MAEDSEIQYERRSKSDAIKVVNHLLSFNASPNIVDIYGASPLCHAVWSKNNDIASILHPFTCEHFIRTPEFFLLENENTKSIRCSNVDQWIQEHTSSVNENKDRLQHLLSSPGIGLLHHGEEIEMQKVQVIALFKRLSLNIKKEDPLLEFVPTLAGSMAEGTKCQKPDEQDIMLRLIKFEDLCIPEESEHEPHGVITLKFNGNDMETKEYQKYIIDGYLNREEILYSLITKIEKELSSVSFWSENDIINIYPTHDTTVELKQAIEVGDIGNLTFIWHGKHYKQIKLSVDVVPAIIIKEWQPGNALTEDPTGRAVPNETFLILRASIEDFDYDLELHGDLNSNIETAGVDLSTLETLNGKDWDSGSDCISEKSDEDCDKDPVNVTSGIYSASMVRSLRKDFGFSIPKTKNIARNIDAILGEINEVQTTNKRTKTAEDNDTKIQSVQKHHKSDSYKDSFALVTTEKNVEIGQHNEMGSINHETGSDNLDKNNTKVIKSALGKCQNYENDRGRQQNTVSHDSTKSSVMSDSNKRLNETIGKTSNLKGMSDGTYNMDILPDSKDNKCALELIIQSGGIAGMDDFTEDKSEQQTGSCETENQDEFSLIFRRVKENRDATETDIFRTNVDQNQSNCNNKEYDKNDEKLHEEIVSNVIASFDGFGNVNVKPIEGNDIGAESADYSFTVHFEDENNKDDDNDEDSDDYETGVSEEDIEDPREDMGFRISYSKWENETMAAFPKCIKTAYILSKILVSYVPKVRTPLNRGIHKNMKGYSSIKDIFSYLLKMALFTVVRNNRGHRCLTSDSDVQDRIEEPQELENTTDVVEQVIYSRTGGQDSSKVNEERKTTLHPLSSNELLQVAFWVNELFSEIEASAEAGRLATYFDPKINILDRIANSGKQKGKPYPAMLYLRKHCKMIRSLVRIEDEKPMLC
ncbi:protein PF3D7_1417600-like [Mercenaria mercenaria]|uniref:protein PF3D7_1417600-like n=1 Tax=Mercenaria mercenaria TaxID=6596 RepID=UPI00234F9726|nr:protein PF3D7_1417600-like [Mercenaria mercenaria]